MALLIVRHRVKDFAAWKLAFEAHAGARDGAALSNPRLYRSADDPKEVVILFDAADVAKTKQFGTSSELKAVMEKAGVIDAPDVYILNAAS